MGLTFCFGIAKVSDQHVRNYLKETSIDIIAPNETFLKEKLHSRISGYDTRNDRSTGQRGGVAFLVKHGLVINKEYRNSDFNIITENEALAINLELSNNQNLTLATISARMEILTFHFFNLLITSLLMSCL